MKIEKHDFYETYASLANSHVKGPALNGRPISDIDEASIFKKKYYQNLISRKTSSFRYRMWLWSFDKTLSRSSSILELLSSFIRYS